MGSLFLLYTGSSCGVQGIVSCPFAPSPWLVGVVQGDMSISAVIQGKVETASRPTREVLEALRRTLQDYEGAFLAQCQQVVEAPMAVRLGLGPDPVVDLSFERQAFKQALTRALGLLDQTEAAERVERTEPRILDPTPPNPKPEAAPKVEAPKPVVVPKSSPYPRLQKAFPTKGIMMVGGFKVPGKLESIVANYGIHLDWVVFEKGSPRIIDSIEARIKNGKVGAVIILEGLMTHKDFRKISAACKVKDVPYAMGDKGGNGALGKAFQQLEAKVK